MGTQEEIEQEYDYYKMMYTGLRVGDCIELHSFGRAYWLNGTRATITSFPKVAKNNAKKVTQLRVKVTYPEITQDLQSWYPRSICILNLHKVCNKNENDIKNYPRKEKTENNNPVWTKNTENDNFQWNENKENINSYIHQKNNIIPPWNQNNNNNPQWNHNND